MTPLDAKRELQRRIKGGTDRPEPPPKTLKLQQIEQVAELFQHRQQLNMEYRSAVHIRDLAKVPQRGQPLDPVAVYWVGDSWVCVDGHHRLDAYRKAKWKKPIPVTAVNGSLDQAVARAARANTHDRLAMTTYEKANTAWRLVVNTDLSKPEIAQAAGVSERSVGNMRHVRLSLLAAERRDLTALSWSEARREYDGKKSEEKWDEDREEKDAQKLADRLLKTLGKTPYHKKHGIFARALEIYDRQLPDLLMQCWRSREPLDFADEEADEF